MRKFLFILPILISIFFTFIPSEVLAVCSYCPTGRERSDSCVVNEGTPREASVDKRAGCVAPKVQSTTEASDDSCQCIDAPPAAAPAVTQTGKSCPTVYACPAGNTPSINGAGVLRCSPPGTTAQNFPIGLNGGSCSAGAPDEKCQCVTGTGTGGVPKPGTGGDGSTATTVKEPDPTPCTGDKCTSGSGLQCNIADGKKVSSGGDGVLTAIGCVPTKPQTLIERILRYGTLAAGGVAFLLMLLAAIQMITAEGNPNTIKTSQEKFYSAIIGLLLIIFSVLLMQVIGVDLLGLRGFER